MRAVLPSTLSDCIRLCGAIVTCSFVTYLIKLDVKRICELE